MNFADAHRIVVKIGSSSLTRDDGGLNLNRIDQVAKACAEWCSRGREVVIVTSGAVAAGFAPLGMSKRPHDLVAIQACAAMGQGQLVARWSDAFQSHYRHVAQILLTTNDVKKRRQYTNARSCIIKLLGLGVIPIVNENDTVATRDVRFGDNDRLAAYVSQMVRADALVLLSDVNGLYSAPPGQEGSHFIKTVTSPEDLRDTHIGGAGSKIGSGGMVTKVDAALMTASSGITVKLTSADQLDQLLHGHDVGTTFEPVHSRPGSRTLWIAYVAPASGKLIIDEGAVVAITIRKKSLLPIGVTQVVNDFMAGEVVDIIGPQGLVARGVSAYDSVTCQKMAGHKAEDLVEAGWDNPRPVVHRDDLAVLVSSSCLKSDV